VTANITLYATWTAAAPTVFTVRFDTQGGTPVPSNQSVASGGKAAKPADLAFEGYVFGGWHKEAATVNAWDFSADKVTANITLYAKWAAPTVFTVRFDPRGGTPKPADQSVASGQKAAVPSPIPAKDGHVLEGWYTEAAYTTKWDFDNAVTAGITLHAKWTATAAGSFVVSFDSRGGSAVDSQTVASGGKADKPPNPNKDNNTFDGWYEDEAYAAAWDFNAPVTAAKTLYAKWTAIVRHSVAFDPQGGAPVPANQSIVDGQKAEGPSPVPTKDGHTLEGWYTEAAYTTKWDFALNTVTADITLHARWTELAAGSFVISFDSKGGSEVAGQTVPGGGKSARPNPDPAKEGHIFDGWYADEAYDTAWDFNAPVTAAKTLYAKWTAVSISVYTVGFNAQGGTPTPQDQSVASGEKAAAPNPAPRKEGYTLEGWYQEATYATKWDFAANTVTANITLHARWDLIPVNNLVVSFDTGQGSAVPDQTVPSGGKAAKPADPTRDLYEFGGWYTGSDHAAAWDFDAPVTADMTLHAKWTLRFVAVTGIVSAVPQAATTNDEINLNGAATVNPAAATNRNIVWTVKGDTTTGVTNADLADGIFTASGGGTLSLTATIVNGTAAGTDFVRDDISIVIVKPVTDITGVPGNGTRGVALNPGAATVVPGDATNRIIAWSVKASTAAGVTTASVPPFTPSGIGTITLLATIVDGKAAGEDYTKEFSVAISEPGSFNPDVGFGGETSLSVKDVNNATIKSGDPVKTVSAANYHINLVNASEYTGIVWYINGTKSTVTGSRLYLDTSKKGLVRVTVEAYKDGALDAGSFAFDVK
jgi:uncharacterized repeat protein (TIGR02543 family)